MTWQPDDPPPPSGCLGVLVGLGIVVAAVVYLLLIAYAGRGR